VVKKKEVEDSIDYKQGVQRLFISFMISDHELFVRSHSILDASYWDAQLRPVMRYILKFAEEYRNLPTIEQIYAETGVEFDKIDDVAKHTEWFLSNIEKFCRHKAMEALILDGPELLEKGDYGELERRSKDNMLITLQKELGTDYFYNPLDRLQRTINRSGMTSTGWKEIDRPLYGGFNRGQLSFFLGLPGAGKSLFLQNLALNWVQQGLNVVYISLELSEELIGLRFDAMITSRPTKQIFKEMEEVALRLGMASKGGSSGQKWGKLQIKKMPEAGTTINKIRAYLKEYEIQNGIKPDAIAVDYLDMLYPNNTKVDINSSFTKDKYTSEELRGLASELNILCSTASQINRCLKLDTKVIMNGGNINIVDIKIGDWIESNEGPVQVKNIFPITKQKVFKIRTKSGREVVCSANHIWPTNNGALSINSGLKIGDVLRVKAK
jgi:archaellum biogenesis ATPase FlaH